MRCMESMTRVWPLNPEMVIRGSLPRTAERLVREWAALNRDALIADWHLARQGEVPLPIGGLDVEQGR
jgi:hypothetical protein